MTFHRLLLYFNTIKYLKGKQFLFNFIRRLSGEKKFIKIKAVECCCLKLTTPIQYIHKIDSTSVCFLNNRRNLEYISDWACMDEPKLWRYNLHYFDYLLDDGAAEKTKDKLIDDWIKASGRLKEDAWEPYPISLRLVNWIKYFISYKNNAIPEAWLQSLYQQAYVLYNTIEHHILANHYLKNGKGLFFAGAYLRGDESKKWFRKGNKILLEAAAEQILDDGGHYEKSPMYHSVILEDYLDVVNLVQSNALDISQYELSFIHNNTVKALDYFHSILMPDGEIPLFNDSAFNIAPLPELIFKYAEQILGYVKKDDFTAKSINACKDSGYYIIKENQSMCVIDCGSVSPDYQPGHTHCDILSYELAIDGCRMIVDSGLYDYDDSEERRYCRSTKAHNTVEIDGMEQSEVWGQFRVARRANVLSASLRQINDEYVFIGSYSPYWSGQNNIVHLRKLSYTNNQWTIRDEISGEGVHAVNNYIHIHPDIDCIRENGAYFLIKETHKLAKITFSGNVKVIVESGWYCPEFGIKRENTVLRVSSDGLLPINQEYLIETLS